MALDTSTIVMSGVENPNPRPTPEQVFDKILEGQVKDASLAGAAATGTEGSTPGATVPAPKPSGTTEAKPDPKYSRQSEALTKKEIALNKREQTLKAEVDAFKKDKDAVTRFAALKEQAKRDPASLAKEAWGDNWYEVLTKYQLEGVPPADMIASAIDDRMSKFEQAQKDREAEATRQAEAAQAAEVSEAQKAFVTDIVTHVEANKDDKSAMIHLLGLQNLIHDSIVEMHQKTGKLLSIEEATDVVEKWLVDSIGKAAKVGKVEKLLRGILGQAQQEATKKETWETKVQEEKSASRPGLTNAVGFDTTTVRSNMNGATDDYSRGMQILDKILAQKPA